MAEVETLQESTQENTGGDQTDLLIAIATPLSGAALSSTMAMLSNACRLLPTQYQATVALSSEAGPLVAPAGCEGSGAAPPLRFVKYTLPPADPGAIPWLANLPVYRTISSLANQLGARACTVLGSDFGSNREALTSERLTLLLDPAMEGAFDLAMPFYNTQPFDDLVNKAIVYPLTRTLYGHRVRNPLGNEFQMSSRLFPALSADGASDRAGQQGRLSWPATIAASQSLRICQVQLGNRRPPSAEGIDLSNALAQLVGPLFLNMEDNAAFWQRIRGSHDVPTFGNSEMSTAPADSVDVRRMIEAFQLGVRNLREIWTLILPPLILLEIKKLSMRTPDEFHIPDTLWTRIVYDFALAHRLRNINRAHLFGALTPLYLGWVASYAADINRSGVATAEDRVEQLARAFESEKPYLLSRWRWPDRFHP